MSGGWRDLDGQKTIFGDEIRVCDICGRRRRETGRHPRCQKRAENALAIVRHWQASAVVEELLGYDGDLHRNTSEAVPPAEIRVLAGIAGVNL